MAAVAVVPIFGKDFLADGKSVLVSVFAIPAIVVLAFTVVVFAVVVFSIALVLAVLMLTIAVVGLVHGVDHGAEGLAQAHAHRAQNRDHHPPHYHE